MNDTIDAFNIDENANWLYDQRKTIKAMQEEERTVSRQICEYAFASGNFRFATDLHRVDVQHTEVRKVDWQAIAKELGAKMSVAEFEALTARFTTFTTTDKVVVR
jgi:hypothetical protein